MEENYQTAVKVESISQVAPELIEKMTGNHPEDALTSMEDFAQMMMRYESASREIRTKLEILNADLSHRSPDSPISTITHRMKKPRSIFDKLIRQGNEISLESIEKNLNDVAGVRVICKFIDDIYRVAQMLGQQDDITIIEVKDYIQNPKPNGYRSYHMIVEVPVFFSDEKRPMRVEVQIRTVAMDFWATQEHQIRYKKGLPQEKADEIAEELKACADTIAETDLRMQAIRDKMQMHTSHH